MIAFYEDLRGRKNQDRWDIYANVRELMNQEQIAEMKFKINFIRGELEKARITERDESGQMRRVVEIPDWTHRSMDSLRH